MNQICLFGHSVGVVLTLNIMSNMQGAGREEILGAALIQCPIHMYLFLFYLLKQGVPVIVFVHVGS